MNKNITIKIAHVNDMPWVNSQYDTVGFKHSNFNNELIVIAKVDGEKVGAGRLQKINESTAELGGIFIDMDYRGLGLASKIVSFLIKNSYTYEKVFCLPFVHLQYFYQKLGFTSTNENDSIPGFITDKYQWCNQIYIDETLLFVLRTTKQSR